MRRPRLIAPTPGAVELVMTILSAMAILVVLAYLLLELDPQMKRLLLTIDTALCVIFQIYFFAGLFSASDRKQYLRRRWIDSVASIPMIEPLRWARIFQVIRVVRLLRNLRVLFDRLRHEPGQLALAGAMLFLVVIMGICSIVILHFEQYAPGPIHTAGDALWWSLVTISTVGYGDFVPVTGPGKLVASVLIIAGVSLFGLISGTVASFVLQGVKKQQQKLSQEVEEDIRLDQRMEHRFETLESHQQALMHELISEVRLLRQEVTQLKREIRR